MSVNYRTDDFVEACLDRGTSLAPTLTVHAGYDSVALARVPEELRASLAYVHPSVAERVLETPGLPAPDLPSKGRTSMYSTGRS